MFTFGIWLRSGTDISNILETALNPGNYYGTDLPNTLRRLFSACVTAYTVQKTLAPMVTLSPHSIEIKRNLSHHNILHDERRSSMKELTMNAHLCYLITAAFKNTP